MSTPNPVYREIVNDRGEIELAEVNEYFGMDLDFVDNKLSSLVQNPKALQTSRKRLNRIPAVSPSVGTPEDLPLDNNTPPEPECLVQRRKLIETHDVSLPAKQFRAQIRDVEWYTLYQQPGKSPEMAVRGFWMEQGIWRDEWNEKGVPSGTWKHEDLHVGQKPTDPDCDSSRPYHQFLHQVGMASEFMQRTGKGVTAPVDINSCGYRWVREIWERRGLWNREWGVLPGMIWIHEEPLENWLKLRMGKEYVASDGKPPKVFRPMPYFGEDRGRICSEYIGCYKSYHLIPMTVTSRLKYEGLNPDAEMPIPVKSTPKPDTKRRNGATRLIGTNTPKRPLKSSNGSLLRRSARLQR
ncbi:hypothetical protein BJX70DRAFT_65454 [Aspergillus crustosus]